MKTTQTTGVSVEEKEKETEDDVTSGGMITTVARQCIPYPYRKTEL